MFVFSDAHVVIFKGAMGEGKTFAGMAGLIYHAKRCHDANPDLKLIRGALVRDTHQNIKTSTVPDMIQEFGAFLSFKDDFKKMMVDCKPIPIEMDLFGIDDPASMSKLQGPQYSIIWLEEPAPIQEKANAGLPKGVFDLSIARASRQKGTTIRVQVTQNPADEDHWTEEVANGPEILAEDPESGAQIRLAVFEAKVGENKHANPLMRAANRAAFKDDPGKWARYVEGRAAAVSKGKPVLSAYNANIHYANRELPVVPGALGLRFYDAWHHPVVIVAQLVRPGQLIIHHACQGDGIDLPSVVRTQLIPLLESPKYRGKILEWRDIGDPSMRQPDQSNVRVVTAQVIMDQLKNIPDGFMPRFEKGPTLQVNRFGPSNRALQTNLPTGTGPQILISKTAYNLHRALNGGWHWKIDNSGNVIGAKPVKDRDGDLGDAVTYGIARIFPDVRRGDGKPKKPSARQVRAMAYSHGMVQAQRSPGAVALSRGF